MSVSDLVDVGSAVGPWVALLGLLLAGLRAILSGALVPRSTLDVLNAQWERQLDESRERERGWRSAYDAEHAAGEVRSDQLNRLIVIGQTTEALLRSLPGPRTPP